MVEIGPRKEFERIPREGRVEVIAGGMFSGKSEELIRRVRRAIIAKQKVQVFKPVVDNRRGKTTVNSYNGASIDAFSVETSLEILDLIDDDNQVVAVDEAQFFDNDLTKVSHELADRGKRVIIAGLNTDFRGENFGPMGELIPQADHVDTLHAICMVCGQEASRTQRVIDGEPAHWDSPTVLVGGEEAYEARCREHHEVPGKPELGLNS